jgi:hypothetical protein
MITCSKTWDRFIFPWIATRSDPASGNAIR